MRVITLLLVSFVVADFCDLEKNVRDLCVDQTCGVEVAPACGCDPAQQIGYYFTTCDTASNTRSLVYFWKPPATCTGYRLPDPVTGIPCSLTCPAGTYLDGITMACRTCDPGTYSIGPLVRFRDWQSLPSQFETYCYPASSTCTPWVANGNSVSSSASSGESALSLGITVPAAANLTFAYSLSQSLDTLKLRVDYIDALAVYSTATATATIALSAGHHTLQWIYVRNSALTTPGTAYIYNISFASIAQPACTPCPLGTYSNASGASSCLLCGAQQTTYFTGATQCTSCPPGSYSYLGSNLCHAITSCTANDWSWYYTECTGTPGSYTMQRVYMWVTPTLCNSTGIALPQPEVLTCDPVAQCGVGERYDTTSKRCVYCGPDLYSPGGRASCLMCSAGTTIMPNTWRIAQFLSALPNGMTAACVGDCASAAWRMGGYYVTAPILGANADATLDWSFAIVASGSIAFEYTLQCSAPSLLRFTVDGVTQLEVQCDGTCNNITRTALVPLNPGTRTVRWLLHKASSNTTVALACETFAIKSITLVGSSTGGAAGCITCPAGTFTPDGYPGCISCPAGSFSPGEVSNCTLCAANSFSVTASASCLSCGVGTSAAQGSARCSFNCSTIVSTSIDLNASLAVYSLSALTVAQSPSGLPPGSQLIFSLCQSFACTDSRGASTTNACLEDTSGLATDIGSAPSLALLSLQRQTGRCNYTDADHASPKAYDCAGLRVSYTNPISKCSLNVNLFCDKASGLGMPQVVAYNTSTCRYVVDWSSLYACPQCQLSDMQDFVGDCNATTLTQTVTRVLSPSAACQGGDDLLRVVRYQNCTLDIAKRLGAGAIIGIIAGVLVVLIALVVVVSIVGKQNRALGEAYSQLEQK